MNMIFAQFHRGLSLRFWLAAMAAVGLSISTFLQPVLKNLQEGSRFFQGYHNELIVRALISDTFAAFLTVLATLPLSAGYLEDVKSKFACFLLIRGGYSAYLLSLCAACWLCGGSALLLGAAMTWGLTALAFKPVEWMLEDYMSLVPRIGGQLVLVFLNGGLWAVLGMALSTLMESKYIAYTSPFIVYYLLVILVERYFPNAWLLYPKNWLDPDIWPYGVGSAAVFLLELTFLCGLVFYIRGKRRLEQL